MKLISLKDQNLSGLRPIKAGEPFDIAEPDASFLVKIGCAKYAEDEKPEGKSPKYKRRDVRAEN